MRVESFPTLNQVPAEACVPFDEIIPQASSHFDFSEQKLVLSFPQAAMHQVARGTVPESLWDEVSRHYCWITVLAGATVNMTLRGLPAVMSMIMALFIMMMVKIR